MPKFKLTVILFIFLFNFISSAKLFSSHLSEEEARLRELFVKVHEAFMKTVEEHSPSFMRMYREQGRFPIPFLQRGHNGPLIPVQTLVKDYEQVLIIVDQRLTDPKTELLLAIDNHLRAFRRYYSDPPGESKKDGALVGGAQKFISSHYDDFLELTKLINAENSPFVKFMVLDIIHRYLVSPKELSGFSISYKPKELDFMDRLDPESRQQMREILDRFAPEGDSIYYFQALLLRKLLDPLELGQYEIRRLQYFLYIDSLATKINILKQRFLHLDSTSLSYEIYTAMAMADILRRSWGFLDLDVKQVGYWSKQFLTLYEMLEGQEHHKKTSEALWILLRYHIVPARAKDLGELNDIELNSMLERALERNAFFEIPDDWLDENPDTRSALERLFAERDVFSEHPKRAYDVSNLKLDSLSLGQEPGSVDIDSRTIEATRESAEAAGELERPRVDAEERAKARLERTDGYREKPGEVKK
ncbi:MAG: hypothetical protein ABIA04_02545 [Pseudomonadota bacterium]